MGRRIFSFHCNKEGNSLFWTEWSLEWELHLNRLITLINGHPETRQNKLRIRRDTSKYETSKIGLLNDFIIMCIFPGSFSYKKYIIRSLLYWNGKWRMKNEKNSDFFLINSKEDYNNNKKLFSLNEINPKIIMTLLSVFCVSNFLDFSFFFKKKKISWEKQEKLYKS